MNFPKNNQISFCVTKNLDIFHWFNMKTKLHFFEHIRTLYEGKSS